MYYFLDADSLNTEKALFIDLHEDIQHLTLIISM